jgi:hypothetical protein
MSSTERADLDQQSYIASTMNHDDRNIGFELLKTGSAVDFRVVGKSTELAPDKENIHVRVDLAFEVEEEDEDPADVVEWAAFGFIFVLAVLSFADARPRGISEVDYSAKDDFTVADFLGLVLRKTRTTFSRRLHPGTIHEDRHNRSIRRNRSAHHLGTWRGCTTLAGPAEGKETDGTGMNGKGLCQPHRRFHLRNSMSFCFCRHRAKKKSIHQGGVS